MLNWFPKWCSLKWNTNIVAFKFKLSSLNLNIKSQYGNGAECCINHFVVVAIDYFC